MSLKRIEKVIENDEIKEVSRIAEKVWHSTYDNLLPKGQPEYMIEKFQSEKAITSQMSDEGYEYYLIYFDNTACGFFALVPEREAKTEMLISKIYIDNDFAGKGLARFAFDFIIENARQRGFEKLWLTVNINNTHAISVYEHIGFEKVRAVKTDIGNGYIMDDFILEMKM